MVLSPKHQAFVTEYVLSNNGAKSAVAAGYSARSAPVTASRLLRKANVQLALRARHQEIETQLQITRQGVLDGLQEAVELARAQANPTALIGAWREIAKMCGYYAPERKHVELSVSGERTMHEIQALSDEELLALSDAPVN